MKPFLLLSGSLLTTCMLLGQAQAATGQPWSYEGSTGPAQWHQLAPANAACLASQEQSPINIQSSASQPKLLPVLAFDYRSSAGEVINNGHTVQVDLQGGSRLVVAGQSAELLQFHFHTPSEERFDGKAFPMDAHLVHKMADGTLSVVAIQLKEGKENPALKALLATLPATGKRLPLNDFDPATLLPGDHSYYRYTGSLTTPPCSDGVRWQVLKQPVELSKAQIAAFRALYPMNARPVQPLNGRVVELSQ